MYCRNCGSQINDNDTYCFNCGSYQASKPVNHYQPINFNEKPKSITSKPWFWVLIVVAVISIYSTLSSIITIFNNTDFMENFDDFNTNNPFSYYEYFEDYDEDFEFNFDIK